MIADSNKFKFKNNTGGKITITSEERSNTVFTHTSHKNKVLKDEELVEYVVTPSLNLNTFQYYGALLHIHYKTEGNETGKHTIGLAHLESCNATMPTSIQVSFAFGMNGLPRMYILRRQSGKYNGQSFYMDDKAKMKLYFEWEDTSLAGKSSPNTPMGWRIDYHGHQIANHDGISKKAAVTSEDVVRAFPLDCSYYGDISLCNEKPVKGIFDGHYTESDSSRNIYSTWKPRRGGFNSGEDGTGGNKLRYLHIAYRDQVSFTKLSDSNFSKVKSSNSFKNIIHIPFGGTNNPEPGRPDEGNEKFYHPERTYELDAGVGSNKYPSNVLYEWEIITAKKAVQGDFQPLLGGRGHRFVTQYSKFTINLNDMGLTWQPRSSDNRWSDWDNQEIAEVRFRVLGSLTENKTDKVNSGFAGRQGSWSRWRSIPRLGWIESLRTFTHGGKFWLGGSLGSVDNYGSEPGPSTETDCGWDGRLVARVQKTDRKTTYWHPLISVNSRLMLCTNKNNEALLYSGKYDITIFFHAGLDFDNDYPNTLGAHRGGINGLTKKKYTISSTTHAIPASPTQALQRDPSLYRGHALDGEHDWSATGTFKTGYECCEVASNTDKKASGFMFDIHTQKCSNFDYMAINRELNGAGQKGEWIIKHTRGIMAVATHDGSGYESGNAIWEPKLSVHNSYNNTIKARADYDLSGRNFGNGGGGLKIRPTGLNAPGGVSLVWKDKGRDGELQLYQVPGQVFGRDGRMRSFLPNIELIGMRHMNWECNPNHWHHAAPYANGYWVGNWGVAGRNGWGSRLALAFAHASREANKYPVVPSLVEPWWGVGDGKHRNFFNRLYALDGCTTGAVHRSKHGSMTRVPCQGAGLIANGFGYDSLARMTIWYENTHKTQAAVVKVGVQPWRGSNDTARWSVGIVEEQAGKADKIILNPPNPHWTSASVAVNVPAKFDARDQSHNHNMISNRSDFQHIAYWMIDENKFLNTHFMIPPGKTYRFCLVGQLAPGSNEVEGAGYKRWWLEHRGYMGSSYDPKVP